MTSDVNITSSSSSSTISLPSKTVIHLSPSPISPLQPLCPIDSMVNIVGESNNGGIFLFETERHLVHTNKYICTLYTVCILGCWICTIPSVIVTTYARKAAQKNQITRAKVMFNIAFIFSFFGLILFAVQAVRHAAMHRQLAVILLVGLAVSVYGLDLSHAAKRSTELEPRILNSIGDLYAQAIYPSLQKIVQSLALLFAKVLTALQQIGIPTADGRTLSFSEADLRGFWSGLWNDAIKPPIENALTGLSLLSAQVLAGIGLNGINLGIGKRDLTEAEMRGFTDTLTQALNDIFTNVIQKPLENALAGGSLLLAQLLAGVGTNGVNLSGLFGKRDLTEAEMRGFTDTLAQALNDVFTNVIQKPLENALAGGSLLLAQLLAGVGTNGVNLSGLFGKRDLTEAEMRGFTDTLTQALNDIFTNVIQKPLENALAGGSLLLAQLLAGVGTNGVNLSGLFGKRDLTEAEMRGFTDTLAQALNDVFTNVIQKPLENALAGGSLLLAQLLAGVGTNGVNLSGLFGKRDISDLAGHEAELRGIFGTVTEAVVGGLQGIWNNIFQVPLENFVQTGSLSLAQILANLGTNGVNLGKRAAEPRGPIIDSLTGHVSGLYDTQVKPMLESAINAALLHLAGVLANFSQGGIGRR